MRARSNLFKIGIAALIVDFALYLSAITSISIIDTLTTKIHTAAWFFLIGSVIAVCSAILIAFGEGWKRPLLAAASLATLPFWYGLTLY